MRSYGLPKSSYQSRPSIVVVELFVLFLGFPTSKDQTLYDGGVQQQGLPMNKEVFIVERSYPS